MKKLIFLFLLPIFLYGQRGAIQVYKDSTLTYNYLLSSTDTNKIGNSLIYIDENRALNIPLKMLGDSLYSRTGELFIEGVKFQNQNIDLPGDLQTYGNISLGGYMELDVLDTNWYGSKVTDGYVLKFDADSSKWIPQAESGGGSSLTEEEVEDYVGGMLGGTETRISVTYQDGTNDIDFVVDDMNQDTTYLRNDIDDNETAIGLNTTHRTSNGTDHTYIDQDLRATADVQFNDLNATGETTLGDRITVDSASAIISSSTSEIKLMANSNDVFRGLDGWTGTWSDASVTTYFQVGRNTGSVSFSARNGSNVKRLLFNVEDDAGEGVLISGVGSSHASPNYYFGIRPSYIDKFGVDTSGNVMATGNIDAGGYKVNTHTITGDTTIASADMYGGEWFITANATVTLPAVATGMSASFEILGAYTAHIDPNASDKMWLNGTLLDDGDKASSTGSTGELLYIRAYPGDNWVAASDAFTDGG